MYRLPKFRLFRKRYRHYVDEGGNSYVADLMNEIRALPKVSMLKEIEMENKKK